MQQENLELFASCLAGLEAPLADELKRLGIKRVRPLGGGVAFFCDVRHALRGVPVVAAGLAHHAGGGARGRARLRTCCTRACGAFAWEDVIAPGASMAVSAHGMNDELRNTRFTALKVKDAVCDRLREARGERPTWTPSIPTRPSTCACARGAPPSRSTCRANRCYRRTYLTPDDGAEAAAVVRARGRTSGAGRLGRADARGEPPGRPGVRRRRPGGGGGIRRVRPGAGPHARALGLLRLGGLRRTHGTT